jgi:hypothetical protein
MTASKSHAEQNEKTTKLGEVEADAQRIVDEHQHPSNKQHIDESRLLKRSNKISEHDPYLIIEYEYHHNSTTPKRCPTSG